MRKSESINVNFYCAKNTQVSIHVLNACYFPGNVQASSTPEDPQACIGACRLFIPLPKIKERA